MLKLQFFGHLMQSWLIGKYSDAGKDWGQEEKVVTKDEMVGWHHWPDRHEFEHTPRDSEGPGSLVCCRSQGVRHDLATEQQQQTSGLILQLGWLVLLINLLGNFSFLRSCYTPVFPKSEQSRDTILSVTKESDFVSGNTSIWFTLL